MKIFLAGLFVFIIPALLAQDEGDYNPEPNPGNDQNPEYEPQPGPAPGPGSDYQCQESGHFAHPNDPTKFIICDFGVAHELNCPEQTIWDDQIKNCNFDWGAKKISSP